jgi:two-component system, LytTR family, sensor kinase
MIREKRFRISLFVMVALCLTLGLVETIQQHVGNVVRGGDTSLLYTFAGNFLPWLPALPLLPLIVLAAERWPMDRGGWKRSLPLHLLAMLGFTFLHQYAASLILNAISTRPLNFGFLLGKMLTFRFAIDALVYWTGVGVTWAARVAQSAREREQAAVKLEATLAEARLGALRDQLNPHFLFNTLNAISTLALREDRNGVVTSLGALSDLLRRSLDTRRIQEVTLEEELELADRFLEIQQIRFGDRLSVVREIPRELLDATVPIMVLQPLLENAFQHGVGTATGPVRVTIAARRQGDRLELEVSDTGPGFGTAGLSEGIGMKNTQERLRHLYGDEGVLNWTDRTLGATVRVTLPYRRSPSRLPEAR